MKGKVVMITGAGRGMGRDVAEAFVRAGAKVMIAARTESYGRQALEELSAEGSVALTLGDVCHKSDIERTVAETVGTFGGLDVVVHCAADVPSAPLLEISDEEIERTLGTIIKASIWLIQAATPQMVKRGGGRIILFSSICGPKLAIPGLGVYGAAKSGVNALIENAALELARHRITVNGIEPGLTDTDNVRRSLTPAEQAGMATKIPLGRIGATRDIANGVLFLASEASAYLTGATIRIDGGLSLHSAGFPLPPA